MLAIFIFLPFMAMVVNTMTRPGSQATPAQVARHLEDFPYDAELAGAGFAPAAVPDSGGAAPLN